MYNAAGVPTIVVCTKADLTDDNNDFDGAGASGMGGMVKGKGDEWEERTDGVMQILRTVCLKCTPASIHLFSFPTYISSLQIARVYSTQHRNRPHSIFCTITH